MAKKKSKNKGFAAKAGKAGRQAVASHRDDDTNYGRMGLPAGIENGIAQLVDCEFATYSKGDLEGEYYFRAAGIVKLPVEHEGVKIEGQRTSLMEPMCDTPKRSRKTVEEHVAWVLNEFRKFDIDTRKSTIDDLEDYAAALVEEKPHFKFRTWKGEPSNQYPDPRVNEPWGGVCEYDESDEEDDVEDETEDDEEYDVSDGTTDDDKPEDDTEYDEDNEEDELSELAEAADAGKKQAEKKLTMLAQKAGIEDDDIENAESWADVVKAIEAASESGDEEEEDEAEEEEDDTPPEKGNVFMYKPPKKKKAIEVEVVTVSTKKETCTLKNLDTDARYQGVPWDKLSEIKA